MFSLFFRKNDGFSLVETMSGIVILTIALLPALGYFANSVGFVHQTETRSQAMDIAVDTMEYFKMTAEHDWSGINTTADSFSASSSKGEELLAGYKNFVDDYTIDVQVSDTELIENVKDITVTVKWDNDENDVSISSLLRNGG